MIVPVIIAAIAAFFTVVYLTRDKWKELIKYLKRFVSWISWKWRRILEWDLDDNNILKQKIGKIAIFLDKKGRKILKIEPKEGIKVLSYTINISKKDIAEKYKEGTELKLVY